MEQEIKTLILKKKKLNFIIFYLKEVVSSKKKINKNFKHLYDSLMEYITKNNEKESGLDKLIIKTIGYKWLNKKIFEDILLGNNFLDTKFKDHFFLYLKYERSEKLSDEFEKFIGEKVSKTLIKKHQKRKYLENSISLFFQNGLEIFNTFDRLFKDLKGRQVNKREVIILNSIINELNVLLDIISDLSKIQHKQQKSKSFFSLFN